MAGDLNVFMARPMTDKEAIDLVQSSPSFLPRLVEYVDLARTGHLFDDELTPPDDAVALQAAIVERWTPVIKRLSGGS